MSQLDAFLNNPTKMTWNGQEVNVFPLTIEEIPLFMKTTNANLEEQGKAMHELVLKVLQRSFPNETVEKINQIKPSIAMAILNKSIELSGLLEMEKNG